MQEEKPLKEALIYRGPQMAAMVAYVPLPVFILEIFAFLAAFVAIKFLTIPLLVIHLVPVAYTRANPAWVRNLVADFKYLWGVSNKDLFGKGVVTFSPLVLRKRGRR
jgi:type IV secretory pathway VirB3-like protein